MKLHFYAAFLLFLSAPLHAQTAGSWQGAATPSPEPTATATPKPKIDLAGTRPSQKPLEEQVGTFFKLLGESKVEEAYNVLLQGSRIAAMTDQVTMLKDRSTDALKLMGKLHGAEQIEKKAVGETLQRLTYLSNGAHFPMRWRFYYYKTPEGWRLIDIRITDRLVELFAEEVAIPTAPSAGD